MLVRAKNAFMHGCAVRGCVVCECIRAWVRSCVGVLVHGRVRMWVFSAWLCSCVGV